MDILLRGGTVIDGSGAPAFSADIGIEGNRIQAVGSLRGVSAELVRDVTGLVVAPGFIDCHSHSDLALLEDPMALPKVAQGVTSEIVGNCGWGPFPVLNEMAAEAMSATLPCSTSFAGSRTFECLEDYREALQTAGTAVNVGSLVAHGPLRLSVVGGDDRPASEAEMGVMRERLRECAAQGALGISFGLVYAPGCFTRDDEIAFLIEALDHPRRAAFHVRNECDRFAESVAEALEIGRRAEARVHISHLKVADPESWGRIDVALAHIERAGSRGEAVTCDQYPYTAGSAPLQTLLPPWSLDGGPDRLLARLCEPASRARIAAALEGNDDTPGWDNLSRRIGWDRITIGSAPGAEHWEGRDLASVARESGVSPAEALFEVLSVSGGRSIGIYHHMCDEDVRRVMSHPSHVVGTDGLPAPGRPHPRLWGTFPRVLGRYVRQLGVLTLEEAVHKMSRKTAAVFGLADRGLVRRGWYADLCLFEGERIADRATYANPAEPPDGIVHVICNGRPTMLDGTRTEHRPGLWVA
jgi:dihydroorotase/N-acyl-D-amino-acid deacylase